MLQPKKTKFRKAFKGRIHGDAKGGTTLNFGSYGLKAMEPGSSHRSPDRGGPAARSRVTSSARAVCGSACSPTFPSRASLPKSAWARARVRRNIWAARVKPGRILFELDGVPGDIAAMAFSRAAMKLPIKVKVVARLGDTSHLGVA